MSITYKALAALLAYPDAELVAALPEIRAVVEADRSLPRAERAALAALVEELGRIDLIDAQERYVALFDRGRATSLHLFEHVHGESRDRGQAMVDLKSEYERAGLRLREGELPDYLPALLEFLSLQPHDVAEVMLAESAHLLRKVGNALAARGSSYAAVLAAALASVSERGLDEKPAVEPDKPIDEEWAEAPVVFGPGAAPSCGAGASAASVVKFMPRPAAR
ncbi:MAG: nitrate reductase molybdenum cofactor assembly chaperone [Betaproteobacteria bacterium]|jgi:nitrate reductase delta subunit|nr:nitrate reductase molybdenum cofactor assembly chaperone [Betaproteobacteria bacterium]